MEIHSITSSDIPEIARLQVAADRLMDALLDDEKSGSIQEISEEEVGLHVEAWTDYFNKLAQNQSPDPLYQGIKAVKDGQIIGCIFTCTEAYLPQTFAGCVEAFFVHPEHWGNGVGRTLMTKATDGLKGRNVSLCRLWAEHNNEILDEVYNRLGWKRTASHALSMMINGRHSKAVLFERHL